ncbi:MAG: YdcF family protein [Agathobacter sp.]|nr:YdcF family protein [Agathobacter sp.]
MIKTLQKIGFLFSLVAFLWFFIPFLVAGICNIGNITGMILAFVLMLYFKCMPLFHSGIKLLWKNKIGKGICISTCILVALITILVIVESCLMIQSATKKYEENATAVVLGCRVYGERPSLSLLERLEAAYSYLTDHPNATCIVSGGKGDGENISEAEAMYRWLTDNGIDASRIYKEDQSTNTDENIRFSKEIIKQNNLNENITIITSEYHSYRAGMLAEKYDLNYGVSPGQTAIWLFPTFYVRELYAILAEWIF